MKSTSLLLIIYSNVLPSIIIPYCKYDKYSQTRCYQTSPHIFKAKTTHFMWDLNRPTLYTLQYFSSGSSEVDPTFHHTVSLFS